MRKPQQEVRRNSDERREVGRSGEMLTVAYDRKDIQALVKYVLKQTYLLIFLIKAKCLSTPATIFTFASYFHFRIRGSYTMCDVHSVNIFLNYYTVMENKNESVEIF